MQRNVEKCNNVKLRVLVYKAVILASSGFVFTSLTRYKLLTMTLMRSQTAGRSSRDLGVDACTEGEAVRRRAVTGPTAEDQSDTGERHRHQGLEYRHRQTRVYRSAQERLDGSKSWRSQLQHDSH